MHISTDALEPCPQRISNHLAKNKPKLSKPALKTQKSNEYIPSLEELIINNFNRHTTSDVTAIFILWFQDKKSSMVIDIMTYHTLEAIFCTVGRLPEEMRAIYNLQCELISNITKLRTRKELVRFLKKLKNDDRTMNRVLNLLISLCSQKVL